MAKRAKKPCKKIGCSNLTEYPNKYCEIHSDLEVKEIAERNYLYDTTIRYKRDKKYSDFYRSKEWKKTRDMILTRDNGLCQECLKSKRVTLADTVHHIVELKVDWNKRLEPENLISLCSSCHNNMHPPHG